MGTAQLRREKGLSDTEGGAARQRTQRIVECMGARGGSKGGIWGE